MSALAQKQHMVSKVMAAKAGAAVTLTLAVPGTFDATTNTFSGSSTTTMTGTATRVPGDAKRYEALGLVEQEAPTLEFVPDTYGDVPALNASLSWGSVTFMVRDVAPWAPDGNAVSSRMIVAR